MTITMVNTPDNLHCTCRRCGHIWQPDTVRMLLDAGMQVEAEQALLKAPPKRCAACKSPYYMLPHIRSKKAAKMVDLNEFQECIHGIKVRSYPCPLCEQQEPIRKPNDHLGATE